MKRKRIKSLKLKLFVELQSVRIRKLRLASTVLKLSTDAKGRSSINAFSLKVLRSDSVEKMNLGGYDL